LFRYRTRDRELTRVANLSQASNEAGGSPLQKQKASHWRSFTPANNQTIWPLQWWIITPAFSMEVADLLMKALVTDLSSIGGDKPEYRTAMETIERAFKLHEAARNRL
jgi:hypothetical protein